MRWDANYRKSLFSEKAHTVLHETLGLFFHCRALSHGIGSRELHLASIV